MLPTLIVVGVGVLVLVTHSTNKPTVRAHALLTTVGNIVGLAGTAIQRMTIVDELAISWPEPLVDVLSRCGLFSFNLVAVGSACFVGAEPASAFIGRLAILIRW